MNRLSDADGHFIAGFLEGEAHFGITEANGGQSFICFMSLRLRDDDAELIAWLKERTGVGRTRPVAARATSKPQVEWRVQTQADCLRLVELLTRFEPRGRKRHEFELWTAAVELWTSGRPNRVAGARRLQERLKHARRFRAPAAGATVRAPGFETLYAYLHGFICAEGSFRLDRSVTGLIIHLRQDDRPLLVMFARSLGVGYVRDYAACAPDRPSATWHVARLDHAAVLARWLDPEQMRGRKAAELEVWLRAVTERLDARADGRRARLDGLIAEFRMAREYRPGKPLAPPHRTEDQRAETLEVLHRWAAEEPGTLSAGRYAAVRRAGWPRRNTIARRFGSWHAALTAAGLADRAASTEEHRRARATGGAAARAAHTAAERERVLATLRYGINVHGSIPTAMQFFRWRLIEAPATPTQGTVYRLFPGGWPAVLRALGETPAGVM